MAFISQNGENEFIEPKDIDDGMIDIDSKVDPLHHEIAKAFKEYAGQNLTSSYGWLVFAILICLLYYYMFGRAARQNGSTVTTAGDCGDIDICPEYEEISKVAGIILWFAGACCFCCISCYIQADMDEVREARAHLQNREDYVAAYKAAIENDV